MKSKKDGKKVLIDLRDVFKHYHLGDSVVKAVDGIDLQISEGEFVSIMGPSGSGQSTSMNIIGSLDVPTKGSVFLDGEDIRHLEESDLAQLRGRKIGFIFQQFNLIPNLTAKENVMLPMVFQGFQKDEREERAKELLNKVGLQERFDHYPTQLSGGEQQRVAIARALANDPEVILADEPTGNLDTKTGEMVMEFLNKLNREGKTVIMITHEPELAATHSQKIFWLKDGKIEKVTKGNLKRRR